MNDTTAQFMVAHIYNIYIVYIGALNINGYKICYLLYFGVDLLIADHLKYNYYYLYWIDRSEKSSRILIQLVEISRM